jgi:hypothetical protein
MQEVSYHLRALNICLMCSREYRSELSMFKIDDINDVKNVFDLLSKLSFIFVQYIVFCA